MKNMRFYCAVVLVLTLTGRAGLGVTSYVDWAASGNNDGTSWTDAYTNLQSALWAAVSNDQIWVARGTNYPGTDQSNSFIVTNRVSLYGGFTNGMASLAERNWTNYETILSGDIDRNGVLDTNNSIHVVFQNNIGATSTVDGFTISGGYADDSDTESGGGGMYAAAFGLQVRNCTFRDNYSIGRFGAGVYAGRGPIFDNCRFFNNVGYRGGAMAIDSAVVTNCLFVRNIMTSTANGYGSAISVLNAVTVSDSLFFNNGTNTWRGGAIYIEPSQDNLNQTFQNCVFIGNGQGESGADADSTIYTSSYRTGGLMTMRNCVFSGNSAYVGGAIIVTAKSQVLLENCSFCRNRARYYGGAIYTDSSSSTTTVKNCVLYYDTTRSGGGHPNEGPEIDDSGGGTVTLTYTDIQEDLARWPGAGNLNTNPFFSVAISTGAWDAAGSFDPNTCQTTLTDTDAVWTVNEHAGRILNPKTADTAMRLFYIVSNISTVMTVWGDASSLAAGGSAYQIYDDMHLRSEYGRWTPGGWLNDTNTSLCIDAGDPASDYAREPRPNGHRINMGAYGNTVQASMSYLSSGMIVKVW